MTRRNAPEETTDRGAGEEAASAGLVKLISGTRVKVTRTNLAAPPTRLVGRHAELDVVRQLVLRERLLSILGAPGMGKTRLARECALRLLDDFTKDGGVWFVDLTEAQTGDDIAAAVARALDVSVSSGEADPAAQLAAAIAARGRILLVLDNVEQVAEPCARLLEEWMKRAREARFMVTSRTRLGIPGETLFELGPLTLPIAGVRAEASDAVQLFVERARAARFDYVLMPQDAQAVATLVRQLDGNALAIELAAARIRVLTPAQMLAQMSNRFDLLAAQSRRLDARHLTLRAAIDASWNLLEPWEKDALAQCSVFAGGFEVEAAAKVLDLSVYPEAPGPLDVVEALRDQSLVFGYLSADGRGEQRFAMYQSIREYAQERLIESRGHAPAALRHAKYYVAKAKGWLSKVDGPEGLEARSELALEMENLLAIHRRAVSASPTRIDAALALEAVLALDPLLSIQGPNSLRFTLIDGALNLAIEHTVETSLLARGHEARADAHRLLGRGAQAFADYNEAMRLAERCGARATIGRVLSGMGILCIWQGKLADATANFERAMAIHHEVGDRTYEARALGWLGNVHLYEGRLELAWSVLEKAIALHRQVGDRRFEGMNVGNLAVVAHDAGRLEEAKSLYERALSIHREVGDRRLEAEVVGLLGVVAHEEARLDDARQLYTRALEMHRQVGNRRAEGTLLGYLGNFLVEVGEREEGRNCFSRALTILRECGDTPTEGLVLGGLAALEASEGCIESSRGALSRATECLKGRDARYLAAVEIDRGHLELALARDATRTGDESRAKMYLQSVRQRIAEAYGTAEGYNMARTGYAHRSADVRLAVRSLRQALEAGQSEPDKEPPSTEAPKDSLPPLDLPAEALVVDARGRWFRAPHGEHVSISRWKSLQNLVEKLAERREIAPGMALSVEDLVAAGWPGERILPKAGATRVYTALSTLRRLGLRDVLTRRDGGYLLSPAVPLVRVSARR